MNNYTNFAKLRIEVELIPPLKSKTKKGLNNRTLFKLYHLRIWETMYTVSKIV